MTDRSSSALARIEGIFDRVARGLTFWSLLLFGLFLLFVALWIPAERRYRKMGNREKRLCREVVRLEKANSNLDVRLRAIRSDRYYIERILREGQGLSGEGEYVVRSRLEVIE
jgi:cell division protein FtsB